MKNYRNADGINLVIGWCYPVEPGGERERERAFIQGERTRNKSSSRPAHTRSAEGAVLTSATHCEFRSQRTLGFTPLDLAFCFVPFFTHKERQAVTQMCILTDV